MKIGLLVAANVYIQVGLLEHLSKRKNGIKKTPCRNGTKHSPNFDTVCSDKDNVQQDLEACPEAEKINWSNFAREHKINAKNEGQIVQEFAVEICKRLNGQALILLLAISAHYLSTLL